MFPHYSPSLEKRASDILQDVTFLWRNNKMIEKLGGVKFTAFILCLIVGSAFAFYTKIEFKEFKEFLEWILGLLVAGNVGAYVATALPEIGKKK
jgi:hypothetical protein